MTTARDQFSTEVPSTDVLMVWYTLPYETVEVSRDDVIRWARELDLPASLVRANPNGALRRACRATVHSYTDNEGHEWTIAVKPRKTNRRGWEVYDVISSDGSRRLRFGEIKITSGTGGSNTQLRRGMDEPHRTASREWRQQFLTAYTAERTTAPAIKVRRIARETLMRCGIPLPDRWGAYLVYSQNEAVLGRLREFMRRCGPEADIVVLPLVGCEDLNRLLTSALDAHLIEKTNELIEAIEASVARGDTQVKLETYVSRHRAMFAQAQEHERRVGQSLPTAEATLALCSRMLDALRS